MKHERLMGAARLSILVAAGACGVRGAATSTPNASPTFAHATAPAEAPGSEESDDAPESGPSFACRGPLDSCIGDPCPTGLACVGDENFACGEVPALGKPCPAGKCELQGADLGTRVCLPDGCCGERASFPNSPGCEEGAPAARFEIDHGATREDWVACLDNSTGRQVNEIAFRDGTRVVFTFSSSYAEHIGEPRAVRGFLKLPSAKLGGAILTFGGGATLERNPYDQARLLAANARVLSRASSEPVDGRVLFGERADRRRPQDPGTIAGEPVPADELHTSTCGTDPEDAYTCSALVGTDAAPTWLFAEVDAKRTLVDAFVAWSRPTGADVFVASRATVDEQGGVELTGLRRLPHADDAKPGDAVVRVTLDD